MEPVNPFSGLIDIQAIMWWALDEWEPICALILGLIFGLAGLWWVVGAALKALRSYGWIESDSRDGVVEVWNPDYVDDEEWGKFEEMARRKKVHDDFRGSFEK